MQNTTQMSGRRRTEIDLLLACVLSGKPLNDNLKLKYMSLVRQNVPLWHLNMLMDQGRNKFYEKILKLNVKNKIVLEIGTGMGWLAIAAAKHGAKHVYTMEENYFLYLLAKKNIEQTTFKNKITLLFGSSRSNKFIKTIPKVDFVLSELISNDIFSEGIVETLSDAKKYLKPTGKFLPDKIELHASLSYSKINKSARGTANSLIDSYRAVTSFFPISGKFDNVVPAKSYSLRSAGIFIAGEKPLFKVIQLPNKKVDHDSYLTLNFSVRSGKYSLSNQKGKNKNRFSASHWSSLHWKIPTRHKNESGFFQFKLLSGNKLIPNFF